MKASTKVTLNLELTGREFDWLKELTGKINKGTIDLANLDLEYQKYNILLSVIGEVLERLDEND